MRQIIPSQTARERLLSALRREADFEQIDPALRRPVSVDVARLAALREMWALWGKGRRYASCAALPMWRPRQVSVSRDSWFASVKGGLWQ